MWYNMTKLGHLRTITPEIHLHASQPTLAFDAFDPLSPLKRLPRLLLPPHLIRIISTSSRQMYKTLCGFDV